MHLLHMIFVIALDKMDLPASIIVKSQPQATCATGQPDKEEHNINRVTSSVLLSPNCPSLFWPHKKSSPPAK